MIPSAMLTTNPTMPGRPIAESLGMVRGLSVRSRSVIGNMGASVQAAFGGQITAFETLCEDTRNIAMNRLRTNAHAMGADAVVGVRYDANELADGITEVLCYGTAVKLEP
jgi:uncharacterized protein YbjQ (UPF0145 family)